MKNIESSIFSYLITNEDFRDWVIHPNNEKDFFWKKWMDEHPEAIEEVKKAREFIERMTFKKEQISHDEMDELLEKIVANETPTFQSNSYNKRRQALYIYHLNQWVKVAAILVICFMVPVLIDSFIPQEQIAPAPVVVEWRTAENPKGIKSKVTLPDGTIVTLNAASEIKYPRFFSESQRLVELKGEAFFEVVRNENKPFIIQTDRTTTEVLATFPYAWHGIT